MASLRCAAQLVTDVPSTSGRHAVTTKPGSSSSSSSRQPHHHQPQLHQCPVLPIQLQPRALSAPRQQPPAQQQSAAAKIGQGAPAGSLQLQAPPIRRLFTSPGPGMPVATPTLIPPGSRTSTPTSAPSQEGSSGRAYPQHSVAPHTSQPSDQPAELQLETQGQQLQRRRKPQRRRFRLTVSRTSSADLFAEPSLPTDPSPSLDVLPGSSSQIGAAHTRSRAAVEGGGARRQQGSASSADAPAMTGQSPTAAGAGADTVGNAQGGTTEADAVSMATVLAVCRLYVQQPELASSAVRGGALRLLLSEDGGDSWRSQPLRPCRPRNGASGSSSGGGRLLMAEVALQPQQNSTRAQDSTGSAIAPPPALQVLVSEGPGHGPPPAGALLGKQLQQHLPCSALCAMPCSTLLAVHSVCSAAMCLVLMLDYVAVPTMVLSSAGAAPCTLHQPGNYLLQPQAPQSPPQCSTSTALHPSPEHAQQRETLQGRRQSLPLTGMQPQQAQAPLASRGGKMVHSVLATRLLRRPTALVLELPLLAGRRGSSADAEACRSFTQAWQCSTQLQPLLLMVSTSRCA